jgi:ADP-ribose pyrophosphatase
MQSDGVEIVAHETAYQGYFRIDRYRIRHRLFAGGISPEIRREVFERGHAVAVILYDPALDAVVLIEQFRIGAFTADFPPWVTEIVAGIIDPGEEPAAVARRETMEETGCEVLDLVPVHRYLVSPGCSSESVTLFCARVDARKAGGIHGLKDEGEDIRVRVIPVAEAFNELASGRVNTSLGLIGLQWLALNRETLRKRWNGERVSA